MPVNLNTVEKLIECLQLQKANLPTFAAAVGATPADMTAVDDGLANLIAIKEYSELIDANKKMITQIKAAVFDGAMSDTIPPFPLFPFGSLPGPAQAGELERAQIRNKRFKLGPGYNEEIGIALGIAGAPQTIDPGTVIPTIEVSAASGGYLFSVIVSGRGQSDMWDVLTAKIGSNTWTVSKTSSGKSTDVTMPINNPEDPQPYQIQVRVRLRKGNDYYGQPSAITQTTVNP